MSAMAESVAQAMESLPPAELAELARHAQQIIEDRKAAFWPEAKAAVDKLCEAAGVTPTQLFARLYPPAPRPPKYVNPDDPTQTWSGRGKEPAWLVALRAKTGKGLGDYLVAPPEAVGVTSGGEVVEGVPGPDGE